MKKIIFGLVALFLIVACAPYQAPSKEGRAVFTITDAAANMSAVSKIELTVDSVQVHSETEGWVTVASSQQTYDLLELKASGAQALLADVELKEGDYQQMRLLISNVIVTDASGEHEAKLPSNELKIVGGFTVNANSTSTATFDFIADESLHLTGKGEYILAPVVKLETREDADVDASIKSKVSVKGGKVKTDVKVGMDENGNVGIGLMIRQNLNLTIDTAGKIKIGGLVSSEAKSKASSEDGSTEAEVDISVSS